MIVSRQNRRIKDIRRILRCKEAARAALEGPHLVAEGLAAGCVFEYAIVTPSFLEHPRFDDLVKSLPCDVETVKSEILEQITDATSPRGIVAVIREPSRSLASIPLVENGLYVFVDGLQDPGNLGALVRAAEAFAATGVVIAPESVSTLHPRVLRASAGSLLRLPVATEVTAEMFGAYLAELHPVWLGLNPRGGRPLPDLVVRGSLVLAVGAEGPGVSKEVALRIREEISIPMTARVESLNATVAVAIALYELRGRRSSS